MRIEPAIHLVGKTVLQKLLPNSYNNPVDLSSPIYSRYLPRQQHVMSTVTDYENDHPEAYYLYFVAVLGVILNCIVVIAIIYRKTLRKMTSGFLIHACFLDTLKSSLCFPLATKLLFETSPTNCGVLGSVFVILVTTSVFNMVAMVCTEAYTFSEKNVGGSSKGTAVCIVFGIILVYIGSLILHLGPTLISGQFEFQPDIGSCSFTFGKQTGYVAHIMWFLITTVAMLSAYHFIYHLYREIQVNRPNRVSFLVRSSITVLDSSTTSTWKLRRLIRDSTHRVKLFILHTIVFLVCWYPFFLLVIFDKHFKASTKVYQFFVFLACSQATIQPLVSILFDRDLNLLASYMKCLKSSSDVDRFFDMLAARQEQEENSYVQNDLQNDLNSHSYPIPTKPTVHNGVSVVQSSQVGRDYTMNIRARDNMDLTSDINFTHDIEETPECECNDNISQSYSVNSETLPSTPSTANVCEMFPISTTDFPPPIEEDIEVQI